jgi:hypothetical protein
MYKSHRLIASTHRTYRHKQPEEAFPWNAKPLKTRHTAPVPIAAIKKATAAHASPITIPTMKYPAVFFRPKASAAMTVRVKLLSETALHKKFPAGLEIIASTSKNCYINCLHAK